MTTEPPITRTNLHDPEEFAAVFMDELRYGQGVSLARASLIEAAECGAAEAILSI